MTQKWQEVTVDPKGAGHTYRLAVPGGWLYRTTTYKYPELHRGYELVARGRSPFQASRWFYNRGWDRATLAKAMEVAQQTTNFVPAQQYQEQYIPIACGTSLR